MARQHIHTAANVAMIVWMVCSRFWNVACLRLAYEPHAFQFHSERHFEFSSSWQTPTQRRTEKTFNNFIIIYQSQTHTHMHSSQFQRNLLSSHSAGFEYMRNHCLSHSWMDFWSVCNRKVLPRWNENLCNCVARIVFSLLSAAAQLECRETLHAHNSHSLMWYGWTFTVESISVFRLYVCQDVDENFRLSVFPFLSSSF